MTSKEAVEIITGKVPCTPQELEEAKRILDKDIKKAVKEYYNNPKFVKLDAKEFFDK